LAQLRWLQVLSENKGKFEDLMGVYLMEKLKLVKFTKQGGIRRTKFGNMALDEFPSLVRMWEEKQDEA
jgi:hypothetical protein